LKPVNKLDLARRLARKSHRSRGEAADEVDNLVYHILKDLKQSGTKPGNASKEQPSVAPSTTSKGKQ